MPIYEYTCQDCGAELEVVVTGAEPRTCGNKCSIHPGVKVYGGGPLVRKVSLPAAPKVATPAGKDRAPSVETAARHGFSTYEKTGTGDYRKVAGEGPERIRKPGEG